MNPFQKNAMNYGAILGMVLVMFFFVQYFLNMPQSFIFVILQYAAIIGIIIWGCMYFRDKQQNGVIKYGRALGMGTMIGMYGSLVFAVIAFVFYKFIDPSALDVILRETENQLYTKGLSESEISMAMEMTKKMMNPLFVAISSLIGLTFWSFLLSLITSAVVMKKNGNGYQNTMNEIENDHAE